MKSNVSNLSIALFAVSMALLACGIFIMMMAFLGPEKDIGNGNGIGNSSLLYPGFPDNITIRDTNGMVYWSFEQDSFVYKGKDGNLYNVTFGGGSLLIPDSTPTYGYPYWQGNETELKIDLAGNNTSSDCYEIVRIQAKDMNYYFENESGDLVIVSGNCSEKVREFFNE